MNYLCKMLRNKIGRYVKNKHHNRENQSKMSILGRQVQTDSNTGTTCMLQIGFWACWHSKSGKNIQHIDTINYTILMVYERRKF